MANSNIKKLILIDSGINSTIIKNNVLSGKNFINNELETNYQDDNGHGTFCASVIERLCPDVEFYILKVLNENAASSTSILKNALKYIPKLAARVVCLSLSTHEYDEELESICEDLMQKNYILVSSVTNGRDTSYPAAFPSVIGVNSILMQNDSDYWYSKQIPIQCVADVTPIMVPNLDGSYKMFGGNSKASAQFSSVILNMLAINPFIPFKNLNTELQLKAVRHSWTQKEIINGRKIDNFNCNQDIAKNKSSYHILKVITDVIAHELNLNKEYIIQKLKTMPLFSILMADDFYKILKAIFKVYNLDVNYKEIKYHYFLSIYTLSNYVEDQIIKYGK